VEAAAYQGRPVYFETIGDWTRPDRAQTFQFGARRAAGYDLAIVTFVSLVVGSVLLARHNLRLGRGDRTGARRLAMAAVGAKTAGWLVAAQHVADAVNESSLFVRGLGLAFFYGAAIWVLYLALEPYVRRRWPDMLISWTRVLSGRLRDPIVARDVLIGTTLGAAVALSLAAARTVIPAALGVPPPPPLPDALDALLGARVGVATLADVAVAIVMEGMAMVLLRLALLRVLRIEWLTAAAFILLLAVQDALVTGAAGNFWLMLALAVIVSGTPIYVVTRLGFLPTVVCFYTISTLLAFPKAPSLGHWAMEAAVISTLPFVALTLYGYQVSRSRRWAIA